MANFSGKAQQDYERTTALVHELGWTTVLAHLQELSSRQIQSSQVLPNPSAEKVAAMQLHNRLAALIYDRSTTRFRLGLEV